MRQTAVQHPTKKRLAGLAILRRHATDLTTSITLAGRSWFELKFGLSSSLLAAN